MSEFQLKDGNQIKSESKNSLINLMKTVDSIVSVDWKGMHVIKWNNYWILQ